MWHLLCTLGYEERLDWNEFQACKYSNALGFVLFGTTYFFLANAYLSGLANMFCGVTSISIALLLVREAQASDHQWSKFT